MSKVLRFNRRSRQTKSERSNRTSNISRNNSRNSSPRKHPQTTGAASVFQQLALVNPFALAMLVNLGRRMLAESELVSTLGS